MDKLGDNVQDQYGNALLGASVAIYEEGTRTFVSLYEDDEVTTKPNPLTTDAAGMWECKLVRGTYDIEVSYAGQSYTWEGFSTPSVGPADGSVTGPTTTTDNAIARWPA